MASLGEVSKIGDVEVGHQGMAFEFGSGPSPRWMASSVVFGEEGDFGEVSWSGCFWVVGLDCCVQATIWGVGMRREAGWPVLLEEVIRTATPTRPLSPQLPSCGQFPHLSNTHSLMRRFPYPSLQMVYLVHRQERCRSPNRLATPIKRPQDQRLPATWRYSDHTISASLH